MKKIINWFKKIFKREKVIMKFCTCKQYVVLSLYSKSLKAHLIGNVKHKDGYTARLYCNGSEV